MKEKVLEVIKIKKSPMSPVWPHGMEVKVQKKPVNF